MLKRQTWIALSPSTLFLASAALAGESLSHAAHDAGKSVKKGVRGAQDQACQMVHGKLHCLGRKIKHKAQNAGDDLKTK